MAWAFAWCIAEPAFSSDCQARIRSAAALSGVAGATSWSSDQLIAAVIALEQKISIGCRSEADTLRKSLQEKYLALLSAVPARTEDIDLFFRAFLVPRPEFEKLRPRLQRLKPRRLPDVEKAFGKLSQLRDVVVLGAGDTAAIISAVELLCGPAKDCSFWNRQTIFRVIMTQNPGVAAYIPEIATLVLSHSLLQADNRLNQFVLVHELAHVWIQDQKLGGIDRISEFALFSGWTQTGNKWSASGTNVLGVWIDALVALSSASAFSILPDAVIGSVETGMDGFVTQRALRESLARNDPSEDLADHIAAFFTMPSRFCWKEKSLAPRKLAWLEKVFKRRASVTCRTE